MTHRRDEGYAAARYSAGAACAARAVGLVPAFSRSASRKASSSDWPALRRGSQPVSYLSPRLASEILRGAARALRDVLAGHLDVHAAGIGALGAMDVEEPLDLADDALEGPRLEAACRRHGIAVHGIARPHHRAARLLHGADERRQMLLDLVGAEAADQRQPPRLVPGVEDVDQAQQLVGLQRRPALQADRIDDAAAELHVRAVGLARAVADPQHVARRRHVVARAHELVAPRQRLLVAQQQGLVAGVEAGRAQRQRVLGGDAEQRG